MKLKNIYLICKNNYKTIENIKGDEVVVSGKKVERISGWQDALPTLDELSEIEFLRGKVNCITDFVPAIYNKKKSFDMDLSEWKKFNPEIQNLLYTIKDIIGLYESLDMDLSDEPGINIKLPESPDFSEFVENVKSLEFVFTKCTFLQDANEKFKFQNIDVGSAWLTFIVEGTALTAAVAGAATVGVKLLKNLASFIDQCIILRSHFLTVKEQKMNLDKLEVKEEDKEQIAETLNKLYKVEVEKSIESLEESTGNKVNNDDGDEIGRNSQCIDKMIDLLDKGMEIYTTLDSPHEVKAAFAPIETKYLSDKTKKMLEKKSSDEE